jgi:hypothetical protein
MSVLPITAERLRELVHYDPETGLFRRGEKVVGWRTNKEGHLRIQIDGRGYLLHRLAFLYMNGVWPEGEVDHINGDPSDNRWANLRPATRAQNMKNRRLSSSNSTGIKGVSRMPDCDRWRADICVDRVNIYLGIFKTPEAAQAAYAEAARKYHGQFANVG